MTTVDVRITGPTGSGTLYLHNGLWGPATSALHALSGKFMNGTLTGPWNIAEIKATVPGAVVREVLAAVDEADRCSATRTALGSSPSAMRSTTALSTRSLR